MTAKKLRLLILALGACGNGLVSAGTGDITRHEAQGSVELSNLGEPEAAVVVAVPAKSAVVAPSAMPASAAIVAPSAPSRAATRKAARDSDASSPGDEEEADTAKTREGETTTATADGDQGAPRPDWAAQSPYASGTFGGGVAGTMPAPGSGSFAVAPPANAATSGTSSDTGTVAQGTGAPGGGTPGPTGTGQVSSVLDSPELLAQRLAQYRQIMLNEPLGPNGLAANPAVQRRYLMINRMGYMGNFR